MSIISLIEETTSNDEDKLVALKDLALKFKIGGEGQDQFISVLNNINFDINRGQTFVLLGESGSGKSLTALSIMDLLPNNAYFGFYSEILFKSKNLLSLSERQMRMLRGKEFSMIFQEPMTSLNPVRTIQEQMEEAIKLHHQLTKTQRRNKIKTLLESVHIKDVDRVQNAYPHQLSGGMRQRVMIAMALSGEPKLLIADEPTTALDVNTATQILKLLKELQATHNMAMLFITHDISVAKMVGQKVGIMQNGVLVEQGNLEEIVKDPKHPYTSHLLNAKPTLEKLPLRGDEPVILSLKNLSVEFPIKKGFLQRTTSVVSAVDNVSFSIQQGETLALVGESGCGKTTLAKAVMGLIKPTHGEVIWMGQPIQKMSASQLRKNRSEVQIIFQDPFGAMDPRFRVVDILLEGMKALNIGNNEEERLKRAKEVLEQVGLNSEHLYRFPHQFSGGQRQRICIARALAVNPKLIVCDEAISSLDVSLGAQILDLLMSLQHEYQISYLFITHNLSIVPTIAHKVAVMVQGRIVEYGVCKELL